MIMFSLVRSTILSIFQPLNITSESCMFPFSAVFALENIQIHVCTSNSSDITPYIETLVNQTFSLTTALNIPYV